MFWFPGAAIPSFLDVTPTTVLLYLTQIVAEAMILTALFNASRGSVLLAVVYHTTFNTAESTLWTVFDTPGAEHELPIYLWSVGLSVVAGLMGLWLTRDEPPVRAGSNLPVAASGPAVSGTGGKTTA